MKCVDTNSYVFFEGAILPFFLLGFEQLLRTLLIMHETVPYHANTSGPNATIKRCS